MVEYSHGLPARLVFYCPEMRHKTEAEFLLKEIKENAFPVELYLVESEAKMLESVDAGSMVISFGPAKGRLGNLLYSAGVPFHITFSKFRKIWPDIYRKKRVLLPGIFILAYLPPNIEKIAAAMVMLYGYDVIRVQHYNELTKAIKNAGPIHLVFDQDMPTLKNKQTGDNRETIFRAIKAAQKTNPRFSVSVIKDFDQGSLFEDLGSSVKEITPGLFSPEEFLSFFRSILFDYHYEKIGRQKREANSQLINLSPYGQTKAPLFAHLMDLKRCFHFSESEQRHRLALNREKNFFEIQDLFYRDSLLSWMDDVFSREDVENKIERSAFMFFERPDGITVSLKSLPPISRDNTISGEGL